MFEQRQNLLNDHDEGDRIHLDKRLDLINLTSLEVGYSVPFIYIEYIADFNLSVDHHYGHQLLTHTINTGFRSGSAEKNPPATEEACVQSLGWEDPYGGGPVTHSSIALPQGECYGQRRLVGYNP